MFGKKRKKTSQFSTYRQSSGMWQWVIAGVVLVVFAVIVGYAYMQRDALESEMLNPPLITPSSAPIKTRAVDPGGIDIPNQDKHVFDLLEKVNKKEINEKIIQTKPPKPTIIEDIAAPQKPAVVIPKKPIKKPKYAPDNADSGKWGIQLASLTTLNDAKNALAKFNTTHFNMLRELKQDLQRAIVNGKTYYRARFMGLKTREEAQRLCSSLKKLDQGCLSVKKQ